MVGARDINGFVAIAARARRHWGGAVSAADGFELVIAKLETFFFGEYEYFLVAPALLQLRDLLLAQAF